MGCDNFPQTFPSVLIMSGVKQGCPLSPTLFAIAIDVLVRELVTTVGHKGDAKAFADDIAVASGAPREHISKFEKIFDSFHNATALSINVKKSVAVPLGMMNLKELGCPLGHVH